MSGLVDDRGGGGGGGGSKDKTGHLGRDDRIHGSLLIINELILNCAFPDEVSTLFYILKGNCHKIIKNYFIC